MELGLNNDKDLWHFKNAFVQNVIPVLLSSQTLTPELISLSFLSWESLLIAQQSPEYLRELYETLDKIDLHQKWSLLHLLTDILRGADPQQSQVIFEQLHRISSRPKVFQHFLKTCSEIEKNDFSLVGFEQSDNLSELELRMRSYLRFLTNKAELLRNVDEMTDDESFADLLPREIPAELIMHLRTVEGLLTYEEIRERIAAVGGVDKLLSQLDLTSMRERIVVAIDAQSVEAGVGKRELVQNALDAIRDAGRERGEVHTDFYYRKNGEEYVEEFRDNGTGVKDFLTMWNESSKYGIGRGFFGSGLNKAIEDARFIEVESVIEAEDGQKKHVRQKKRVERDENGANPRLIDEYIQEKFVSSETETFTIFRFIRLADECLPELEAQISQSTYKTMAGLATSSEISGQNVSFYTRNEEGNEEPWQVSINVTQKYQTSDGQAIIFAESSLNPTMSSGGLRMSGLYTNLVDYNQFVPAELREVFEKGRVSVSLPITRPTILDRSRLADEKKYLPEIRSAIFTESLRFGAMKLLDDPGYFLHRLIPQDVLSETWYQYIYDSSVGARAYEIAQKVSSAKMLSEADIQFVSENQNHLVLILAGVEKDMGDGKKDSLLRRFVLVQRAAEERRREEALRSNAPVPESKFGSDSMLSYLNESSTSVSQSFMSGDFSRVSQMAENSQNLEGQTFKHLTRLEDTSLPETEKTLILNYYQDIGFKNVYFASSAEMKHATGLYIGSAIYLNEGLLDVETRQRVETITHEDSHLLEARMRGLSAAQLDQPRDVSDLFTHQQDGPFAQFYKIDAGLKLLHALSA